MRNDMRGLAVMGVALAILGVSLFGQGSQTAVAEDADGVIVGIDMDPSGNTATSVGTIDDYISVSAGDVIDIDVFIDDLEGGPASVDIYDGGVDIDNDGDVDANDDGFLLGFEVIDGRVDMDGDGDVDAYDDGTLYDYGYSKMADVYDGGVDIDDDGDVDGDDDGTASFGWLPGDECIDHFHYYLGGWPASGTDGVAPQITARNHLLFLNAAPDSLVHDGLSEALPDSDDPYYELVVDFGTSASECATDPLSQGVLARYTLDTTGAAPGVYELTLCAYGCPQPPEIARSVPPGGVVTVADVWDSRHDPQYGILAVDYPVGGTRAEYPDVAGTGGGGGYNYVVAGAVAAGALIVVAAGGWYARRRSQG